MRQRQTLLLPAVRVQIDVCCEGIVLSAETGPQRDEVRDGQVPQADVAERAGRRRAPVVHRAAQVGHVPGRPLPRHGVGRAVGDGRRVARRLQRAARVDVAQPGRGGARLGEIVQQQRARGRLGTKGVHARQVGRAAAARIGRGAQAHRGALETTPRRRPQRRLRPLAGRRSFVLRDRSSSGAPTCSLFLHHSFDDPLTSLVGLAVPSLAVDDDDPKTTTRTSCVLRPSAPLFILRGADDDAFDDE
mmetsp:Transcript_11376/g.46097  ORF Transcript_11376/g.46097 Transcript_11376/m.46097 type:complete len:246 (+) Transcript_11376:1224-1961(+)